MGTRSTVKFIESGIVVSSFYQQYDGYVEGVGAQVARTLKRWVVEGVTTTRFNEYLKKDITETNTANGIHDLALLYVMDNKQGAYNMYATHEGDKQEFNYQVEYDNDLGYLVNVYEEKFSVINNGEDYETYEALIFTGGAEEFIEYVEGLTGEPVE